LHEVVAVLPDKESAERLVQSLDGVVGTYRQKANVADREYSERKRQAADAADKAADRLIAKARGEAQ
jgi:F0F1-type ATP synthase membrane subunit b/b'